ncbi:hypothetical protein RclHR1_01080027 [Rhizophagus clarus]|uniref:Uncharacterized protein n=1 Tax=Rhizophagus clarus TaxID=94130 RepID=A0A2Z6QH96_9GLOM|nr:hypothetical protein RclHR1_01080027 [Rhizophagus clarus]GES90969.1 hypothetical protein GLOIN_2v1842518 [Rhizophagus clarus]
MPKAFLKKNYYNRTFINPTDVNFDNSKLNAGINIGSNNISDILNYVRPSFPPIIKIDDLINNAKMNNKRKSIPNAFIVYRMALIKEYRIKNRKLPPMSEFSKIAKNSWDMEPKEVKDYYEDFVKKAKSVYNRNNVQIVMDKHMSDSKKYVKPEKSSNQTESNTMDIIDDEVDDCTIYGAEQINNIQNTMFFPIENTLYMDNSHFQIQNFAINAEYYFPDIISFYPNQDYITTTEQVIDYMLGNY